MSAAAAGVTGLGAAGDRRAIGAVCGPNVGRHRARNRRSCRGVRCPLVVSAGSQVIPAVILFVVVVLLLLVD